MYFFLYYSSNISGLNAGEGGCCLFGFLLQILYFFQHKSHKNVKICDFGYNDEIN